MKAARSLLLSCLLVNAMGHSVAASNHRRQGPGGVQTTPTTTPTVSPPSLPTTTTSTQTSTEPPENTSKSTTTSNSPPTTTSDPPKTRQSPRQLLRLPTRLHRLHLTRTKSLLRETVIVTVTNPPSTTTSSSETSSPSNKDDENDTSSGLGTGSIIGISVAGGVAVIAIIAFLVWKFTRKRFADFDDNEAIKWPELNTHGGTVDSHPLPVHNTGRSGFDTGSEASLSRVPSSSNYSTPDLPGGGGPDPYAVPPLPHMNPNQPYRDDPTAATGYYDPYRGPVPGTLEHGASADDWAGEAIPMTQMTGRVSPGPHAAYVGEHDVGRRSPGPQAAYGMGRTGSPGPQAAYGGRASPGPQAAYGGRASPGPQAAYSTGRMSPGPQASYEQYGGR
ncbi:hypothetical protein D9615_010605 [Tricholomella constricta]|uniref:Uncharacterized protein n=1 Tax=Tricholomella constricta TaxID=117010 RepID=A0A8H5GKJ7_9AGAR|nr:hypothetical protein D9615_010605 [Tricholomella constricta]